MPNVSIPPRAFVVAAALAALAGLAGPRAPAAAPAAPADLPADSIVAAHERDRAETLAYYRTDPRSPLAAIARQDLPATGWLTLGSAHGNDVVIDDPSVRPQHLRVRVEADSFHVQAVDLAATFGSGGEERRDAVVPPSWLTVGRFRVRLSYQNAPAVIVFDPRSPNLASGHGPTWFPIDLRYRFVVPLVPAAQVDTVRIASTNGPPRPSLRVGSFAFTVDGTPCRLFAYRLLEPGVTDDDLGVFFQDATTGRTSYGTGRYVNVEKREDGLYVLDFNGCYCPSCAYSPYYNCPVPPAENRLPVAIEAGESWTGGAH